MKCNMIGLGLYSGQKTNVDDSSTLSTLVIIIRPTYHKQWRCVHRGRKGAVRPNSVLGPNTVLPDVTMPFSNKDASVAMPTLNS